VNSIRTIKPFNKCPSNITQQEFAHGSSINTIYVVWSVDPDTCVFVHVALITVYNYYCGTMGCNMTPCHYLHALFDVRITFNAVKIMWSSHTDFFVQFPKVGIYLPHLS
jgi:hypothetical protein